MTEAQKPSNEIKIGFKSKPKEVIAQCEKLIKDEKFKDLHLSAISTSIGDLVIAVEILKSMFPNLSQQNIFTTISPLPNEKSKKSDTKIEQTEDGTFKTSSLSKALKAYAASESGAPQGKYEEVA